MAKKKSETSEKSAAPKKKAAKVEQTNKPQGGMGFSGIDTDLAASAVARMLAAKAKYGVGDMPKGGETRDSGSFKHLKESIDKKSSSVAVQSLHDALGGNKTSNQPTRNEKHSQTSGNVSRINVPRRTVG